MHEAIGDLIRHDLGLDLINSNVPAPVGDEGMVFEIEPMIWHRSSTVHREGVQCAVKVEIKIPPYASGPKNFLVAESHGGEIGIASIVEAGRPLNSSFREADCSKVNQPAGGTIAVGVSYPTAPYRPGLIKGRSTIPRPEGRT